MGALSKSKLRQRLAGHPFLFLLVYDFWFRIGLITLLVLLVSLGLFLPRIWTVSPPGFRPVIKVSGLDLAQAWSLKRSAVRSADAGRIDDAHFSWLAAWLNNRADAEAVRGDLDCFLRSEDAKKYRTMVVPHSVWLLRLTETNRTDLEIVAKVLARYDRSDVLLDLLESRKQNLTQALEAAYLKALYQTGRTGEFRNRWPKVRSELAADEELPLYHAALEACREPLAGASDAVGTLRAALNQPALRTLACRLLMTVCQHRLDAEQHTELLALLKDWRMDTFPDHVGYWRLLALCGRRNEALEMAQSLACRPTSAGNVLALAELYEEWSMKDRALRVFKEFAGSFQESTELGVAYTNALIEARRWEELRRVSVQMRVRAKGGHGALTAYSYYLEGRAELGLQRQFHAAAAFETMTDWDFDFPKLGLRVAHDLIELGYARLARDVLLKLEDQLAPDAEYWKRVFQAGAKLNQTEVMLKAAGRTYELRPHDPASAHDYAAALLIERQRPEEAIRLTLSAVSRHPQSIPARVNHAAALLLNERAAEALALLRTIDPTRLTGSERTHYHFNLFQACHRLQRYGEAAEIRSRIDPRELYPRQARWLDETLSDAERVNVAFGK